MLSIYSLPASFSGEFVLAMADKLSEYSSDSSETFGSAGSPPPTPSESFTTETTPNDSQMVSAKQRRHTLK